MPTLLFCFHTFATMIRLPLLFLWILGSISATAQIRMAKLVLKPKQVYELIGTDILVVDSLIMYDSSRLVLNKLKPVNFIHAKVGVFYRGAVIDGKGVLGIRGRTGRTGSSAGRPCSDGTPGLLGSEGTNGGQGTNVAIYLSDIVLKGMVIIDVSGGDGGDGGRGGTGGDGSLGTRVCKGGNGAIGGPGANGGSGGTGGSVTFIAPRIPELRLMLGDKIMVRIYGGNLGLGGEGGLGGSSGLSPLNDTKLEGKPGRKGPKGLAGKPGKPGGIFFTDK